MARPTSLASDVAARESGEGLGTSHRRAHGGSTGAREAEGNKGSTGRDGASAPKQREGTPNAMVLLALLERAGGATLEEIVAATPWQKH